MSERDRASAQKSVSSEPKDNSRLSVTASEATLDSAAPFSFSSSVGTAATVELKSIGPYQLIRKLGEGGMGQVWLAEQTSPVRRTVALKLIRVGQFDNEVLHRFQAERQSLAVMDHPSIAKVFDAGSTPDGQPYFVMEVRRSSGLAVVSALSLIDNWTNVNEF